MPLITGALNSGNKRLHIIDFSILFGFLQWNSFIKEIKEQYVGLQSVLISSIAPKLSKHSDYLRQNREWARHFGGTNLELRQLLCNRRDDIVNCISKLRRKRKDEIVVVNFTLHKLLAQDGAMEQVLSKVKDLEADIMVIVEQEANLNSPDLSEQLEQSFQYYSTIFESLEEEYNTKAFWEMYFRRQIGNAVACERVDRVERIKSFDQWQNRLSRAGFCPVPQQVDKLKIDLPFLLKEFGIEEKEGHILLRRHRFPLAVASVWKVTDPPQFSGDTVDDSEGMASSSESEDDEENNPCTMADRNLSSTHGSSINRIAASTTLYDILECICDLHRLPLAVTWISFGQDGNTNSKGKRILCIDDSACYEGQGIAGKALQSNIHIQHNISLLHPAEFPDARYRSSWQIRTYHAAFATRLTSTHPCKDDYVLEFILPGSMKETSERELLINKILQGNKFMTLNPTSNQAEETREHLKQDVQEQSAIIVENASLSRKCLKLWKVSVREVNGARGSEVRLDDETTPNIPQEIVSRVFQLPSCDEGNGFMTVNPTSNQAEETREPLRQKRPYILDAHPSCVQSQASMCQTSFSRLRE
ncbi:hypothetical protein NC651_030426 [Populus alba x Populus x berolinensis]|nr:hypothetical protein NC651_030426 [Populus alba x Populus x berolinensis]